MATQSATDEELARRCREGTAQEGSAARNPYDCFDPADLRAPNEEGQTVWHVAAYEGRLDILAALKRRGLLDMINVHEDTGDPDFKGRLPIDLAVEGEREEAARVLVTEGADVELLIGDGSIFASACASTSLEFIRWLRERVPPWHITEPPDKPVSSARRNPSAVPVLQYLILEGSPLRAEDLLYYPPSNQAKTCRELADWAQDCIATAEVFRTLILGCGVHAPRGLVASRHGVDTTRSKPAEVGGNLPKLRGYGLTEVRFALRQLSALSLPPLAPHQRFE